MVPIDLTEEESRQIPEADFSAEAALALYHDAAKRVSVAFPTVVNERCYELKSNGYIGYLPLDDNYALRIRPKVPVANVFGMLEYAYQIKRFELLEGTTSLDAVADVFENLAAVLAKRVLDRSRKGFYLGYVPHLEALPQPRGRIMALPTALSLLSGVPNCVCEYEDHTSDLEDNRILAWTLYQLSRSGIQRKDVRLLVRRAFRELVDKVSLHQTDPQTCLNRLYHRLNLDYRPMHSLCRFFLEHTGPAIEVGDHAFIPFVVHMPTLFESFVAEWLKGNLPDGVSLSRQYHVKLDPSGRVNFKIDLMLSETSTDRVLAVLDTKYKRDIDPDEADVHQVVAYATSQRAKNAILIYPSKITVPFDGMVGDHIRARSVIFDIGENLESAGQTLLAELLT